MGEVTEPTTAAQIILERDEYFLLRDVLTAAGHLLTVGPNETWALWNSLVGKVFAAKRYEGTSDGT